MVGGCTRPEEEHMPDIEANKRAVVEYYELAFNQHQPEEAVARYLGPEYIQHNPQAPDGPEAFIGFVNAFPQASVDIRTVIAEDDLVATHSLLRFSDEDERGTVAVDIFRLDGDGKIVEHWDVLQPFPETSENDHPMF
jgi:predicted SnoaL-like aldol condensation-catalyzing enzyme